MKRTLARVSATCCLVLAIGVAGAPANAAPPSVGTGPAVTEGSTITPETNLIFDNAAIWLCRRFGILCR